MSRVGLRFRDASPPDRVGNVAGPLREGVSGHLDPLEAGRLSVVSFPLHDLHVDEIENGIRKRRRDDEHDDRVGNPAERGDPGREEGQTGEKDEPGQVDEARTRDTPRSPWVVCTRVHPSEAITRKLIVQRTGLHWVGVSTPTQR